MSDEGSSRNAFPESRGNKRRRDEDDEAGCPRQKRQYPDHGNEPEVDLTGPLWSWILAQERQFKESTLVVEAVYNSADSNEDVLSVTSDESDLDLSDYFYSEDDLPFQADDEILDYEDIIKEEDELDELVSLSDEDLGDVFSSIEITGAPQENGNSADLVAGYENPVYKFQTELRFGPSLNQCALAMIIHCLSRSEFINKHSRGNSSSNNSAGAAILDHTGLLTPEPSECSDDEDDEF
ncbi:hypothetical protein FZEAL_9842 [Fusarium zealandicum]|uniref:Uncharacterized protein n=1 Tax=Fusarium zealandicum TaxID=1053134 RepID=A0A8H4U8H8_9HYPO|nr:hypothetical protein FZEAL_9842 [Fusarium zealandicum]